MKKLFVILLVLAFSSPYVYSQSELPKFASKVDKIKVKLDMPLEGRAYKNGTGYTLNPKMLKALPKKVALVSFYTFDPGFTQTYSFSRTTSGYYYDTKTTTTVVKKKNSGGNAGPISLGFYVSAIDILKTRFKEMGMELLEPEEFLDSEAKKTFYENYTIERSKFNEFLTKSLNSGKNHDAIYAYPDGYKVVSIDNEPFGNYEQKGRTAIYNYNQKISDSQLWINAKVGKEITSIQELTTALGVDAVVFFYSTIHVTKQSEINLQNVNMLMFGPNVVPLPEGKSKKFNYFPGQMYIGTRVNVGVPILKINKKDPNSNLLDFRGYGNIVEAMTNRMQGYFDKAMGKK